ncbi:TRAP transporter small permease [Ammoniphilus sp. YIM 78166]|uniref:TRAP transporter small permease n=1 Tax=Ammoniphilus sp. YIM 78166 TaxID=1644106 RepID=UPI00106F9258|nr:TRAP transporter small permease [Ammoniphilus sp. YIM 78166]
MKAIQLFSHWTDRICRYIMIIFMAVAFVCTVYQVFSRYVLQSPLVMDTLSGVNLSLLNFPWLEELIRYLFIWIVFLGIGVVYKLKGHAQVEIIINFLPLMWKRRVGIVVELLNMTLFSVLFVKGLAMMKITSGQLSPSLGMNMGYMYTAIVACSLICFIHSVSFLLQDLTGGKVRKNVKEEESPAVTAENVG